MADWQGLLIIAGKSVCVYVFILLAIRLFGKRELAQLSVIDLVFILLISNSVQNAMVGNDSSLIGGLSAAVALFLVNFILKYATYKFPSLGKAVQGEAVLLVYDGKVLKQNLEKIQITMDELEEAVREHGVKDCSSVNMAVMEVDGNISVISDDYKNRSVRRRKAHKAITKQQ